MFRNTRLVRRGEGNWGNIIIIVLVVVIGLAVGGFFLVRYLYRSSVLSPFQSSVNEYTGMKPQADTKVEETPHKGGVIPVDTSDNTIDHFYFDLPENLKASDPASVKTIVFLTWSKQQTHQYSNNKPGYTNFCAVDVVDRETKNLLKRGNFQGPPPPQSISGRSSSGEGARPTEEIVAFLRSNMR